MVFIPDTGSPITMEAFGANDTFEIEISIMGAELTANFEPSFTRPRNYNILGMDFLIEAPADNSTQILKIRFTLTKLKVKPNHFICKDGLSSLLQLVS